MQKPHLFREGKERDAFPQQLLRKYLLREITARGRLRLGRAPERFAGGTCRLGPDPPRHSPTPPALAFPVPYSLRKHSSEPRRRAA